MRLFLDQLLHLLGPHQEFMNTHSALISRIGARRATRRPVKREVLRIGDVQFLKGFRIILPNQLVILRPRRIIGFLAFLAKGANQSLGHDAQDGVSKVERIHAQIEQPCYALWCTVGVEGREHEVPGQRGLNPNMCRFLVPHLPDHDHIRVGPQEGTHGSRKIKTNLVVDLHLTQTDLGNLHRVFRRPYLNVWFIDVSERRMQGCRLAGARRAADKDNTVRFRNNG